MASANEYKFGVSGKASGLIERDIADTADGGAKNTHGRTWGGDGVLETPAMRRKRALWVDIVLLLLLAAILVGGILGYRAVKRAYAPRWETREIVFVVEFPQLDAEILPTPDEDYWHLYAPLYTEGDELLGYLIEAPHYTAVPADGTADGRTYKTVRMTLQTAAQYRVGEGYYCGEVHILAGLSGKLRIDGVSGRGQIIEVCEKDEYTDRVAARADGGQT